MVEFCFDVGSPYAYLAAERLEAVLGSAEVAWRPVLVGGLFKLAGRRSWARGEPEARRAGMAEIEARATAYGLPPVRWPDPWPGDYLFAMRAVTFAAGQGAGEAMARACMQGAFQSGADLSIPAVVLDAAVDAGLDRAEVEDGAARPETKAALREATEAAHARGVFGVPTVLVGDDVFWGDDRLEDAARALRA